MAQAAIHYQPRKENPIRKYKIEIGLMELFCGRYLWLTIPIKIRMIIFEFLEAYTQKNHIFLLRNIFTLHHLASFLEHIT